MLNFKIGMKFKIVSFQEILNRATNQTSGNNLLSQDLAHFFNPKWLELVPNHFKEKELIVTKENYIDEKTVKIDEIIIECWMCDLIK